MYKIFIALIIGCISKDIFAACPASISGKYSGQSTYTEFDEDTGTVHEVAEKLIVVSFGSYNTSTKKGTFTLSLFVEASSSDPEMQINTSSGSGTGTYTYNASTCSLNVPDPDGGGDTYLVVANSGNTLYGVKRDIGSNGVQRYLFTKQ